MVKARHRRTPSEDEQSIQHQRATVDSNLMEPSTHKSIPTAHSTMMAEFGAEVPNDGAEGTAPFELDFAEVEWSDDELDPEEDEPEEEDLTEEDLRTNYGYDWLQVYKEDYEHVSAAENGCSIHMEYYPRTKIYRNPITMDYFSCCEPRNHTALYLHAKATDIWRERKKARNNYNHERAPIFQAYYDFIHFLGKQGNYTTQRFHMSSTNNPNGEPGLNAFIRPFKTAWRIIKGFDALPDQQNNELKEIIQYYFEARLGITDGTTEVNLNWTFDPRDEMLALINAIENYHFRHRAQGDGPNHNSQGTQWMMPVICMVNESIDCYAKDVPTLPLCKKNYRRGYRQCQRHTERKWIYDPTMLNARYQNLIAEWTEQKLQLIDAIKDYNQDNPDAKISNVIQERELTPDELVEWNQREATRTVGQVHEFPPNFIPQRRLMRIAARRLLLEGDVPNEARVPRYLETRVAARHAMFRYLRDNIPQYQDNWEHMIVLTEPKREDRASLPTDSDDDGPVDPMNLHAGLNSPSESGKRKSSGKDNSDDGKKRSKPESSDPKNG